MSQPWKTQNMGTPVHGPDDVDAAAREGTPRRLPPAGGQLFQIKLDLVPLLVLNISDKDEAGAYAHRKYEKGLSEAGTAFLFVTSDGALYYYASVEDGYSWERAE